MGFRVGATVGNWVGEKVDPVQQTFAVGSVTEGSVTHVKPAKGYGPQLNGMGTGQAVAVGDIATHA